MKTLVAILDFQFVCVTMLQATRRLSAFYCGCYNSPNVIIGIPKVSLLVNRNKRVSVKKILSVQIVYI